MKKNIKMLLLILSIICCIGLIYNTVINYIEALSVMYRMGDINNWEYQKYITMGSSSIAAITLLVVFNVMSFFKQKQAQ